MISIKNLTVSYKKGKNIIDNLQLSLEKGKIHALVGLNGAGKTTLINTIFGLKKPNSGTILFDKKTANKKEISYLPTENFFYQNITGHEFLDLFENENFNITNWNSLFNLPLEKIIDEYSTGMKKKLAILSVLKQDKPILMLDEPFNGLDIETCRVIRSILLKLKTYGKTIVITSHIIETLTNLSDFIHFLEEGKIKYSHKKEDFALFEQTIFKTIELKNKNLIDKVLH